MEWNSHILSGRECLFLSVQFLVCSIIYLTYPFHINYILCILEIRYRESGRSGVVVVVVVCFWYMNCELGPKLKTLEKSQKFCGVYCKID